jgi:D-3-phosphoglycerate dehydrogenase
MLEASGFEIVRERGPLSEARMLELAGSFDAFLCGDDAITQAVIERSLPRLKIISKYGIGVDKIDVKYATAKQIPVLFTPGVNHTTVAEHTFLLLLALEQNFLYGVDASRKGEWKRKTGHEVLGKTIGIVGLGRIGKEVASRARAFGMQVVGYDIYWDEAFAQQYQVRRVATLDEIFAVSDYLSLHTNLTPETRDLVGAKNIAKMKKGVVILNCARGEIVNTADMVAALQSGQVGGYGTDVLDAEPPPPDHPLLHEPNCIVTPHVASRTYESVVRQAVASVTNLLRAAKGEKPLAQVNPEVPVRPI